jgi:hypothetical protein
MALARAKTGGYSEGDEVTTTEINTINANAALAVRRVDTESGWRTVPLSYIGETSCSIAPLVTVASTGIVQFSHTASAVTGSVFFGLSLPEGHTFNGMEVFLKLNTGHTAVPAQKPAAQVIAKAATATVGTVIASGVLTYASAGAYNYASAAISVSTASTVIAGATTSYTLKVTNESGTGAVGGMNILGARIYMTIDTSSGASSQGISLWV